MEGENRFGHVPMQQNMMPVRFYFCILILCWDTHGEVFAFPAPLHFHTLMLTFFPHMSTTFHHRASALDAKSSAPQATWCATRPK